MGKYSRKPLKHGVSTHPTFQPIYWAEVEIVDETCKQVHVINRDSSISGTDAAKKAVDAADAWIAAQNAAESQQLRDWQSINPDALLEAICRCSHDLQGNGASWECIAQQLEISFPKHVYALCEDLEMRGLVVRAARFIVLTEQGKEFCKSRKTAKSYEQPL